MFYTVKSKAKPKQTKKRELTINEKGMQNELENVVMPLQTFTLNLHFE